MYMSKIYPFSYKKNHVVHCLVVEGLDFGASVRCSSSVLSSAVLRCQIGTLSAGDWTSYSAFLLLFFSNYNVALLLHTFE